MRTFAFALVALLSPGLAAAQAAIQSYPAKTIRIIVPWARRIFHIGAAQLIQKVRLEAALHNAPGLDV